MDEQELTKQSNKLKRKLTSSAAEVQAINDLGRVSRDDPTKHATFKGAFRAIEKYYTQFEDTWDQLIELYEDAEKPTGFPNQTEKVLKANTKRYYYEANSSFEEIQMQIQTQLAAAKPPAEASANATLTHDATTASARVNKILPRINLPNFDGLITNWPKYRDTYTSLIHNDTCLSNTEKFHYLLSSLTDSAKAVISNIPLLDTNYTLAWDTLKQVYNNERMLASAYLNKLIDYKPQSGKPSVYTLQHFLTHVSDNIAAFNQLKITSKTDFVLFHMAIRCLDPTTREQFELQHKGIDFPTFDDLTKFLRDRVLALQLAEANSHKAERNEKFSTPSLKTTKPNSKTALLSNTSVSNYRSDNCIICKENSHPLFTCKMFTSSTVDERHNMLRGWKGCRNCLRPGHTTKTCKSTWSCKICRRKHSSLLHNANTNFSKDTRQKEKAHEPKSDNPENSENNTGSAFLSSTILQESNVVLGTVVAEIQDASGSFQRIRMVVDSGSQQSFMTSTCFKRLGLTSLPYQKKISAIGQTIFEGCKGKVNCVIRPKYSATPLLKTEAVVVNQITSHLPNFTLPRHVWHQYTTYQLADPDFWKPGPIDFLLGADLYSDIFTGAIISVQDGTPKLFASVFGHIVIGKTVKGSSASRSSFFTTVSQSDDLLKQLQGFWEIEEPINITQMPTPEEHKCEEHFLQTHHRTNNGQYVVRLPFKDNSPHLHSFEKNSLKRFHNLETKLNKDVNLKNQYHDFMQKYEDLGHMNSTDAKSKFILPHHCVVKNNQPNGKLRVVFDASAQSHGKSLNECLLPGPKLQADIKDILMRFRLHPVAFVTDIVKMFRSILIDENDRSYQHIWWRFDETSDVLKYQLNTVTYGMTCSPFLAQRVMNQLTIDEGKYYPKASKAINEDMYVDDIVSGSSSISEALELQSQLVNLLKKGQFALSKWSSNRQEILQAVHEDTGGNVNFSSNEDGHVKILGLQWNPANDSFSYDIKPVIPVYTKRAILSTIAKIYDPLGFLAPFVLMAKNIIQDLWKIKVDWDDEIPPSTRQLWEEVISDLPHLQDIKIPRHTQCGKDFKLQIIGFADASNKGYCAALYLRCISEVSIKTYLITAKTKLSPLKTISIPRLELNGALLLSRLYKSTKRLIDQFSGEVLEPYFFTDSSIVLCWLQTQPHNLKVFVANRVSEITTTTPITSWLHVQSSDNPADCGSRGLKPSALVTHPIWWTGPPWLSQPIEQWPISTIKKPMEDLPELKASNQNTFLSVPKDNEFVQWMTKFSSFSQLLRVFGWMLRFISKTRHEVITYSGPLRVQELTAAAIKCVKIIQLHFFFEDDMKRNKAKVINQFQKLSPFFDEDGVLRVGGRLSNSCLNQDQRHPILLPKCHFTILLVDHFHRINLHPGPSLLQALIQLKYWIPSLRNLVRQRTFKCITCYKRKAKTFPPKMADLPSCRVQESRVFLHVGVDFAGPMLIRESLRRKAQVSKAYICLFVCMSTKAIHLEPVTSLSTEAFMSCLHRFISRRGLPEHIYSDCGTNFQGAANKIKELYSWYNRQSVQEDLIKHTALKGIQWHFNPPHAPHFGGLWEAGVKSTKNILYKIAVNANLTFEELYTLLTQVEAVLNSRPLCPLSSSPEETNYLSPGHFLIGGNLLENPEPSLIDRKDYTLSRWQLVQKNRDYFWKRWRQEYLTTLQRRNKWTKLQENLKKGDLVLLKEKNVPFLQWPLAKIEEVHPGRDGQVRVVTVKTQDSSFKRPTVDVIPLLPLQEPPYET